jgi:hypothetical protein
MIAKNYTTIKQAIVTTQANIPTNSNEMIDMTERMSVERKLQQHSEFVMDEIVVLKKLTYTFLFLMLALFFYLLARDCYFFIRKTDLIRKSKCHKRLDGAQRNLIKKPSQKHTRDLTNSAAQFELNETMLLAKAQTSSFGNAHNALNNDTNKSLFNNDKHIFKY